MLIDQLAYRKSDQMGQTMIKTFFKYLNLQLSSLKELKNTKTFAGD